MSFLGNLVPPRCLRCENKERRQGESSLHGSIENKQTKSLSLVERKRRPKNKPNQTKPNQTKIIQGKLADGSEFDSSVPRNQPFEFKLGSGQVIKGWDQGLLGACKGEKRKLVIPPELGYGNRKQAKIPANSVLIFDTEIIDIIPN